MPQLRQSIRRRSRTARVVVAALGVHALLFTLVAVALGRAAATPRRAVSISIAEPGPPLLLDALVDFPGTPRFVMLDRPETPRIEEECCVGADVFWDDWDRATRHVEPAPFILFGRPTIGIGGGQFHFVSLGVIRMLAAGDWIVRPHHDTAPAEHLRPRSLDPPGRIVQPPASRDRSHFGNGTRVTLRVTIRPDGRVVGTSIGYSVRPYEVSLAADIVARRLRFDPIDGTAQRETWITIGPVWPDAAR